MDRKLFFNAVRAGPLFGTRLSVPSVQGTEAILDAAETHNVRNSHHVAHILAHVYHETGTYMLPIKETVFASHKNKNPSDATVISRLNTAFAKGQLSWVRTPYWRDGWFGRGPIQITHKVNYESMGLRLGVNLVQNRDLALDPKIGAEIAVVGMSEGMFTGMKLSDYKFPQALNNPPAQHPRRIVNGVDGTDKTISDHHRAFHDALMQGGFGEAPTITEPEYPPMPARTKEDIAAEIRVLLDELEAL